MSATVSSAFMASPPSAGAVAAAKRTLQRKGSMHRSLYGVKSPPMQKKAAAPRARRQAARERAPLTPALIVEAALAEIDAKGLDGFSMRGLGTALGVEAMALYHHFPSKGR